MSSCNFILLKTMSTLPQTYKDLPHIIPLDFSSTLTVPETHAWFDGDDDSLSCLNDDGALPIIDLMDPNAPEQMCLALEKWGSFRLKNHGIPFEVLEGVEEEAKRFFSLPLEQKLKAATTPPNTHGYSTAKISRYYPKLSWYEGYTISGSVSDDAKKIWPNEYAYFCELMDNFGKQMKNVAEKLTEMVLKYMGTSEENRKWIADSNTSEVVQLNFYPSCPEPKRAMGLGAHTDTSIFTMVHIPQTAINSNNTGLQIFHEGKGWVHVQPHPNTLLINTGDLLRIMSNGRFPCARHRVTVDRVDRYSMAYFYYPPKDYLLSPFLGGDPHLSLPRFRDITVKDYIAMKAKNLGDGLPLVTIN